MERLSRVHVAAERKVGFCGKERRGSKASNGVVCGNRQVSMHEMWNRQQEHEFVRKIHRAKVPVKKLG